ncbi:MAG: hypothetical protein ACRDRH_30010, partial [Pseudonocardia sp.]
MAVETEGGWSRVARHALLAGHDWSTRPPRPSPEQQWSAVADVAALAQAVTILDRDLLAAARQLDHVDPAVAQALDAATVSGLRVAAQEASALAATGSLPEWGEPGPDTAPTRVLIVRSPEDLAAAQARIATQVAASIELSPQTVDLLTRGVACQAPAGRDRRDVSRCRGHDREPRALRASRGEQG